MKSFKRGFSKYLSLLFVLLVAGCGTVVPESSSNSSITSGSGASSVSVDKSKKQIYVSIYNGGHGTAFLEDIIRKFNNEIAYDQGYEAVMIAEKKNLSIIAAELSTNSTQVYLTADSNFIGSIYEGHLAEVSDILNSDVDGNGKTIRDKMSNPEEWESIFSKNGSGVYALPWADCIVGLVYDHDTFIDNNWYFFATDADEANLTAQGITFTKNGGRYYFTSSTNRTNYEQGDVILAPGKDGTYGTYDDGQPVNITQWETMISKIYNADVYPFMWSGYADVYLNHLFTALLTQYGGLEDYYTASSFDSNGVPVALQDGTSKVINIKENGYEVNKMQSLYKAYEFIYNYMGKSNPNSQDYIHPYSTTVSVSHNDVQKTYLLGNAGYLLGSGTSKQSAMLVDGIWWEYEARTIYPNLGTGYNYGDRDFRYLLLPVLEGQKMAADQTAFAAGESGTVLIANDSDQERLAVTKSFVKYLLKDESLLHFTKVTGATTGYDLDVTSDLLSDLTPFTRNAYELISDKEHITIVRPNVSELISPLSYASNLGVDFRYKTKIDGIAARTIQAFKENDLTKVWDGSTKLYTQTQWDAFISQAQRAGFLD